MFPAIFAVLLLSHTVVSEIYVGQNPQNVNAVVIDNNGNMVPVTGVADTIEVVDLNYGNQTGSVSGMSINISVTPVNATETAQVGFSSETSSSEAYNPSGAEQPAPLVPNNNGLWKPNGGAPPSSTSGGGKPIQTSGGVPPQSPGANSFGTPSLVPSFAQPFSKPPFSFGNNLPTAFPFVPNAANGQSFLGGMNHNTPGFGSSNTNGVSFPSVSNSKLFNSLAPRERLKRSVSNEFDPSASNYPAQNFEPMLSPTSHPISDTSSTDTVYDTSNEHFNVFGNPLGYFSSISNSAEGSPPLWSSIPTASGWPASGSYLNAAPNDAFAASSVGMDNISPINEYPNTQPESYTPIDSPNNIYQIIEGLTPAETVIPVFPSREPENNITIIHTFADSTPQVYSNSGSSSTNVHSETSIVDHSPTDSSVSAHSSVPFNFFNPLGYLNPFKPSNSTDASVLPSMIAGPVGQPSGEYPEFPIINYTYAPIILPPKAEPIDFFNSANGLFGSSGSINTNADAEKPPEGFQSMSPNIFKNPLFGTSNGFGNFGFLNFTNPFSKPEFSAPNKPESQIDSGGGDTTFVDSAFGAEPHHESSNQQNPLNSFGNFKPFSFVNPFNTEGTGGSNNNFFNFLNPLSMLKPWTLGSNEFSENSNPLNLNSLNPFNILKPFSAGLNEFTKNPNPLNVFNNLLKPFSTGLNGFSQNLNTFNPFNFTNPFNFLKPFSTGLNGFSQNLNTFNPFNFLKPFSTGSNELSENSNPLNLNSLNPLNFLKPFSTGSNEFFENPNPFNANSFNPFNFLKHLNTGLNGFSQNFNTLNPFNFTNPFNFIKPFSFGSNQFSVNQNPFNAFNFSNPLNLFKPENQIPFNPINFFSQFSSLNPFQTGLNQLSGNVNPFSESDDIKGESSNGSVEESSPNKFKLIDFLNSFKKPKSELNEPSNEISKNPLSFSNLFSFSKPETSASSYNITTSGSGSAPSLLGSLSSGYSDTNSFGNQDVFENSENFKPFNFLNLFQSLNKNSQSDSSGQSENAKPFNFFSLFHPIGNKNSQSSPSVESSDTNDVTLGASNPLDFFHLFPIPQSNLWNGGEGNSAPTNTNPEIPFSQPTSSNMKPAFGKPNPFNFFGKLFNPKPPTFPSFIELGGSLGPVKKPSNVSESVKPAKALNKLSQSVNVQTKPVSPVDYSPQNLPTVSTVAPQMHTNDEDDDDILSILRSSPIFDSIKNLLLPSSPSAQSALSSISADKEDFPSVTASSIDSILNTLRNNSSSFGNSLRNFTFPKWNNTNTWNFTSPSIPSNGAQSNPFLNSAPSNLWTRNMSNLTNPSIKRNLNDLLNSIMKSSSKQLNFTTPLSPIGTTPALNNFLNSLVSNNKPVNFVTPSALGINSISNNQNSLNSIFSKLFFSEEDPYLEDMEEIFPGEEGYTDSDYLTDSSPVGSLLSMIENFFGPTMTSESSRPMPNLDFMSSEFDLSKLMDKLFGPNTVSTVGSSSFSPNGIFSTNSNNIPKFNSISPGLDLPKLMNNLLGPSTISADGLGSFSPNGIFGPGSNRKQPYKGSQNSNSPNSISSEFNLPNLINNLLGPNTISAIGSGSFLPNNMKQSFSGSQNSYTVSDWYRTILSLNRTGMFGDLSGILSVLQDLSSLISRTKTTANEAAILYRAINDIGTLWKDMNVTRQAFMKNYPSYLTNSTKFPQLSSYMASWTEAMNEISNTWRNMNLTLNSALEDVIEQLDGSSSSYNPSSAPWFPYVSPFLVLPQSSFVSLSPPDSESYLSAVKQSSPIHQTEPKTQNIFNKNQSDLKLVNPTTANQSEVVQHSALKSETDQIGEPDIIVDHINFADQMRDDYVDYVGEPVLKDSSSSVGDADNHTSASSSLTAGVNKSLMWVITISGLFVVINQKMFV